MIEDVLLFTFYGRFPFIHKAGRGREIRGNNGRFLFVKRRHNSCNCAHLFADMWCTRPKFGNAGLNSTKEKNIHTSFIVFIHHVFGDPGRSWKRDKGLISLILKLYIGLDY